MDVSLGTALREFVSLTNALFLFEPPPPPMEKGSPLRDEVLFRLDSKFLLRALLTPSMLLGLGFIFKSFAECTRRSATASTVLVATVDFAGPGVEGAPGLSS